MNSRGNEQSLKEQIFSDPGIKPDYQEFNFAIIYLANRFVYQILEFLRHWYVASTKIYSNSFLNLLRWLDYRLAWRITFRYLFHPLYKDYSVLGYILGFIFRASRLLVSTIVYFFIFLIALFLYLVWVLAIPAIIYFVFK